MSCRKSFVILRVFASSWWIVHSLYRSDAKTQRITRLLQDLQMQLAQVLGVQLRRRIEHQVGGAGGLRKCDDLANVRLIRILKILAWMSRRCMRMLPLDNS